MRFWRFCQESFTFLITFLSVSFLSFFLSFFLYFFLSFLLLFSFSYPYYYYHFFFGMLEKRRALRSPSDNPGGAILWRFFSSDAIHKHVENSSSLGPSKTRQNSYGTECGRFTLNENDELPTSCQNARRPTVSIVPSFHFL